MTKELLATEVWDGFLGALRFDENGDTTLNPITILRIGRGGPGISNADVDFAEGWTVERVITPSPLLESRDPPRRRRSGGVEGGIRTLDGPNDP